MGNSEKVQQAIDRIVSEVLEAAIPELRTRLAERIHEELRGLEEPAPAPESAAAPDVPSSDLLLAAIAPIHDASSQVDILGALLNGTAAFSGRSALIVVKRDSAKVWRARGFESDAVRDFAIDSGQPLPARAIETQEPVAAAAADMGGAFVEAVGNPADGNATLLPLVVSGKVKALLYADGGDGSTRLDSSALQLLMRSTATWLELQTLRKEAPTGDTAEEHETTAVQAEVAPPAEEPAPIAAAAAAGAEAESSETAPAPVPPAEAAPAAEAEAPLSDVHRKAKRFAKLLVDEIRLYNKEKVVQGRESKDLYALLREDIEKSRATYDKRFGQSEAASADYFTQELIRVLADNDVSLLGSEFRQ